MKSNQPPLSGLLSGLGWATSWCWGLPGLTWPSAPADRRSPTLQLQLGARRTSGLAVHPLMVVSAPSPAAATPQAVAPQTHVNVLRRHDGPDDRRVRVLRRGRGEMNSTPPAGTIRDRSPGVLARRVGTGLAQADNSAADVNAQPAPVYCARPKTIPAPSRSTRQGRSPRGWRSR